MSTKPHRSRNAVPSGIVAPSALTSPVARVATARPVSVPRVTVPIARRVSVREVNVIARPVRVAIAAAVKDVATAVVARVVPRKVVLRRIAGRPARQRQSKAHRSRKVIAPMVRKVGIVGHPVRRASGMAIAAEWKVARLAPSTRRTQVSRPPSARPKAVPRAAPRRVRSVVDVVVVADVIAVAVVVKVLWPRKAHKAM